MPSAFAFESWSTSHATASDGASWVWSCPRGDDRIGLAVLRPGAGRAHDRVRAGRRGQWRGRFRAEHEPSAAWGATGFALEASAAASAQARWPPEPMVTTGANRARRRSAGPPRPTPVRGGRRPATSARSEGARRSTRIPRIGRSGEGGAEVPSRPPGRPRANVPPKERQPTRCRPRRPCHPGVATFPPSRSVPDPASHRRPRARQRRTSGGRGKRCTWPPAHAAAAPGRAVSRGPEGSAAGEVAQDAALRTMVGMPCGKAMPEHARTVRTVAW